uniref:Uncharacterized protein n=1 Tax=Anguilla anguilla TaxID=7936 RepID=A0A0E9XK26_ANGAN
MLRQGDRQGPHHQNALPPVLAHSWREPSNVATEPRLAAGIF